MHMFDNDMRESMMSGLDMYAPQENDCTEENARYYKNRRKISQRKEHHYDKRVRMKYGQLRARKFFNAVFAEGSNIDGLKQYLLKDGKISDEELAMYSGFKHIHDINRLRNLYEKYRRGIGKWRKTRVSHKWMNRERDWNNRRIIYKHDAAWKDAQDECKELCNISRGRIASLNY